MLTDVWSWWCASPGWQFAAWFIVSRIAMFYFLGRATREEFSGDDGPVLFLLLPLVFEVILVVGGAMLLVVWIPGAIFNLGRRDRQRAEVRRQERELKRRAIEAASEPESGRLRIVQDSGELEELG